MSPSLKSPFESIQRGLKLLWNSNLFTPGLDRVCDEYAMHIIIGSLLLEWRLEIQKSLLDKHINKVTDSEKAIFQAIKCPNIFDIVLIKLKTYTKSEFQCLP